MSNTSLLGSYGDNSGAGLMFRNRIINGGMDISQRYGAADATYTAANIANGLAPTYITDRFSFRLFGSDFTAGDVATAAQSTDAPEGFTSSLKITAKQNVAFSGNRLGAFINHPIEGLNVLDFSLGTSAAVMITLSFWIKSNKTGTVSVNFENAAASRSYGAIVTIAQAATWEKKTVTLQLDSSGTWLKTNGIGLNVNFGVGSNGSWLVGAAGSWSATRAIFNPAQTNFLSSTNDFLAITGVQLEAGPVATPFERRPIGTELALCQRYFLKQNVPVFQNCVYFSGAFQNIGSTQTVFPTVMRDIPTVAVSYTNDDNTASVAISGLNNSRTAQGIRYAFTVSNLVFPYAGFLITSAVSAEL